MKLQPYFDFAKQFAYRAARTTLSYYNKGIQPELRFDEPPLTAESSKLALN